jgi:PAS domain S-box-containing protein
MFKVLTCLTVEHDWRLVVLAVLICFLASLAAINLFHRARAASGRTRLAWLATAGAAAGCGIWATHFIAMLAYEPGIPVAYSVSLLALSLAAAALVTGIGLSASLASRARWAAAVGGGIVGAGVAAMHYTGMWALQVPGHITWDPALVAASIAFGIVFGMGALAIAVRRDEVPATLIAALLLTLAIVSHHFTAMGAVEIVPDPTRLVDVFSLSPTALALAIAGTAVAVLGMSLAGAFADRRLREKDEQLATALNNMAQGLLMFDRDNRLILSNSRYLEMYGLAADALKPGVTHRELLSRRKEVGSFFGDTDEYCDTLEAAIAQGRTTSTVQHTADGRTIHKISRPIADGGWVATHEDVTERVSAERERDRTRDLFNLIVENVPVTIFVKNAEDRRFVLVNRACENDWGLPRSEILNKTAYDIFPQAAAEAIKGHDEQLLKSSAPLYFDEQPMQMPRRGKRFVNAKTFVVRSPDDSGRYIVGVIEDVTDHKLSEERLRQGQKMETIGNLTGGLAHDFNNLLTVIIGNLDVLQEFTSGNPVQKKLVDLILEASLRGAELTNQLLAFSRRQPLHPKLVNLASLIEKTSRLLTRTLGEKIRLVVHTEPDAGPIVVDEAQMQAALINMAVNARDAMPKGGTLTIKTSKSYINGQEANRPPGLAAGEYAVVAISDTGCGMPPDVLARIFEPFFTTKAPGKGTGLGLSMVYGFVRQSGGHISAESEVGNGTTLKLFFPCDEMSDARAHGDVLAQHASSAIGRTELILAVDDDPTVLGTAVLQLEALGYRTLTAQSAEAALQVLDRHPQVDVLFTDVVMPGGLNGRELAKLARIKRPGLKVVYASGFPGMESTAGKGVDFDAPLIAKPYRKNDLARVLDEVLKRPEMGPAPEANAGARGDWLTGVRWQQ